MMLTEIKAKLSQAKLTPEQRTYFWTIFDIFSYDAFTIPELTPFIQEHSYQEKPRQLRRHMLYSLAGKKILLIIGQNDKGLWKGEKDEDVFVINEPFFKDIEQKWEQEIRQGMEKKMKEEIAKKNDPKNAQEAEKRIEQKKKDTQEQMEKEKIKWGNRPMRQKTEGEKKFREEWEEMEKMKWQEIEKRMGVAE